MATLMKLQLGFEEYRISVNKHHKQKRNETDLTIFFLEEAKDLRLMLDTVKDREKALARAYRPKSNAQQTHETSNAFRTCQY